VRTRNEDLGLRTSWSCSPKCAKWEKGPTGVGMKGGEKGKRPAIQEDTTQRGQETTRLAAGINGKRAKRGN